LVGKTRQAVVKNARHPLADKASPQRQAPGDLRERLTVRPPYDDLGALGQPRLNRGGTLPRFQLSPLRWGTEDDAG
jgi:hypothetical protein